MSKNIKKALAGETNKLVHQITNEGIDCIIGGWPCQDISTAGRGAGLSGKRSGLWRYLFRAIRLVRPKVAVLENVAALLHSGMGRVLGDLATVGYDREWHCLSAFSFGLAHKRRRCWIVAYAAGTGRTGALYDHLRKHEDEAKKQEAVALDTSRHFEARLGGEVDGEPPLFRGNDGRASRVDRLRAIGNGNPPEIVRQITGIL